MTDTTPKAVAARVEHMRFCLNNMDADLIEALSAQLDASQNERDEMAAAIDSIETAHGLTDNGNLWRFWSKMAREVAAKNNALSANLEAANKRHAAAIDAAARARDAALVEASTVAKAAISGACQKCGHPRDNHTYRHPFVGRSVGDIPANILALRDKPAPFPAPSDRTGKEPCGECRLRPGETCDICNAYMPAHVAHHEMHAADAMRLLRDKPAPGVTVQDVIRDVWGCCEELEDEAFSKLSVVKSEHEIGFWTGQKMTAKRIRRATQMPIAGGGDE